MILYPERLHVLAQQCLLEESESALRHTLRNQLGAVRNASFIIKRRIEPTGVFANEPKIAHFFDVIEQQIEHAVATLDASRRLGSVPAEPPPTDVVATAARLLRELQVPSTVQVARPGAEPVTAAVAANELELALFCLVQNAIDAVVARGGGKVAVEVTRDGDRVLVSVTDDGAGFEAGARDRALEAGFSTKPGHPGLGLPVARRLATRWRGQLSLDAGPEGRGVRATLAFPAKPAA